MNQELTDKLYAAAPVFYGRLADEWGFECGDGWYDLLLTLGLEVEKLNQKRKRKIRASQVKQKLGGLRCYYTPAKAPIDSLVMEAEQQASQTCEACGKPGKPRSVGGWLAVTCPLCRRKR